MTPLLPAPELSERLGYRVLLKCENLQRTGSFKFRGAYNFLAGMTPEQRARGVVAYSSGNHAQGVAAAAAIFSAPATIVMPADAPAIKIAKTRGYGAEVLLYDRYREEREAIGEKLVAERGLTLVRPYDDPRIVAGQGTCGLEMAEQAEATRQPLDRVLVCCGGGGLTAGIALALEARSPQTRLYTCEPTGFDDTARSLSAGRRLSNAPGGRSICDALLAAQPGELTFTINAARVSGGLTVTDSEAEAAMSYAFRRLKLVLEPGGAVLSRGTAGQQARDRGRRDGGHHPVGGQCRPGPPGERTGKQSRSLIPGHGQRRPVRPGDPGRAVRWSAVP